MRLVKLIILLIPFVSLGQIPNCVPIRGEYLWMSKTEVSNRFYHEFLSSISKEDSLKNYPEETNWREPLRYQEPHPLEEYYFRHPAYCDYPVVNITYENAKAYCDWLTSELNKNFPQQKVLARLPTEKEWEDAAKAGNKYASYPWGTESMRVEEGKYKGNFQANFVLRKGINMMDGATITAKTTSYWPNDFGLYNMSGNVAEMTSEKGLVKGGSWRNRADWLRIDKQQYVYSASPEVGFRYVVEAIELPVLEKTTVNYWFKKKFFRQYFSQINDTLFVGKFEVTNKLFQNYLNRLCGDSTKHPKVRSSNWNGLFPYSQVWENNYATHKKYENYPVVNIDYESAMGYCKSLEWEYKRTYGEEVEMRLPTKQEWELAARGGLKNSPYPWGGPYARNVKGDFLANHNPKMSEGENVYGYDTLSLNNFFQSHFTDLHDYDGEAVIAPVDSYFPNGYGIYNISGNAAEMVLDSNFTKGGSWKSKSYFLQINSEEEWDKQGNPFTGFRIVMIRKLTPK